MKGYGGVSDGWKREKGREEGEQGGERRKEENVKKDGKRRDYVYAPITRSLKGTLNKSLAHGSRICKSLVEWDHD